MNWDAVGAYGCPVSATTPNIDRLAAEGIRFEHAHVTIAVCQPSRSVLMTGRYPHRSGGEGFFRLRYPGISILPGVLRSVGYRVGILGKVEHSTPYADFQWDMSRDVGDLGRGRNPALYGRYTEEFLRESQARGSSSFLMVNSHDPHRPFFGNDPEQWYRDGEAPPAVLPSRTFEPQSVTTPGFLADVPDVRLEIAEYYNSVRRADDTVGAVLDALRESGNETNTLVVFLSDNGMAFPFSKTNCYLHSTKTPWIMRWQGVIRPETHDTEHLISGIDLMPTLLDVAGAAHPKGMDGCSVLSVVCGERQPERELVFTQFHQTAGNRNYPMRCVQSRCFGYIFNPWSNGSRVFINESQDGRTMNAMRRAAESSAEVAARVEMFQYRVPEEFYDFRSDPDALNNLIDDKRYTAELQRLQAELEQWMLRTEDPALEAFRNRHCPNTLESLMQKYSSHLGGTS